MTKLSPAARAVLTAVTQRKYSLDPEDVPQLAASIASGVATALRAAAEECAGLPDGSDCTWLLAEIANELEAR
jgi:hypothetical protein